MALATRRITDWFRVAATLGLPLMATCARDRGGVVAPEAAVASVRLVGVPSANVVLVNDTVRLGAVVSAANGTELAGKIVSWTTSDATIAAVSTVGLVRFISAGFATITASAGGRTASTTFDVAVAIPMPAAGATQPTTASLFNGMLTITAPPGAVPAGTVLTAAPASPGLLPINSRLVAGSAFTFGPDGIQLAVPITVAIRFDSSQFTATQIFGLGMYAATSGGWTRVPQSTVSAVTSVVSAPLTHFSSYAILKPIPPAKIVAIAGDAQVVLAGTAVPISPSVQVLDSTSVGVVAVPVTFTVTSGNGTILGGTATTDSSGVATVGSWLLGSVGANSLTASIAGVGSVKFSATALAPISSVSVAPKVDTLLALGATITLTATAKRATGEVASTPFNWLSRAPSIAPVTSAGVVTAVSAGATYIVVSVTGGPVDSALVVVQSQVATVVVSPASLSLGVGGTATLSAVARDANNSVVVATCTYSSSSLSIISVDSMTGVATGVSPGTASLQATCNGVRSNTVTGTVAVLLPMVWDHASLTIGPRQYTQEFDLSISLRNQPTSVTVNFTSDNPAVFPAPPSVFIGANGGGTQIVTPSGATLGIAHITATALGREPATMTVSVVPGTFFVSISPGDTITAGASGYAIIIQTGAPDSGPRVTVDSVTVTLTSSDPSVAAVDSASITIRAGREVPSTTPLLHGLKPGSVQVAVTPMGGASLPYGTVTQQINVVPPQLSLIWIRQTIGIGMNFSDPVNRPFGEPPVTLSITHPYETHTNAPATVAYANSVVSASIIVVGVSEGLDTMVVSAPGYVSSFTAFTVVKGIGDVSFSWPQSLHAGDSVLVNLVARFAVGDFPRTVAQPTVFTLDANSNIAFSSASSSGTTISSVTIPTGASTVSFYVKGLSAGTGTMVVSAPNFVTYSKSVAVIP